MKFSLKIVLFFFFTCVFSTAVIAKTNITRVVYVTFDGTRWQDIFLDHSYFPKLWEKYANLGTFYGAPESNTTIETASIPVSLPSYQSQMAGFVQPCDGNQCGRIQVETVVEAIIHRLGLNRKEAATFSSWPEIGLAVENVEGTSFTNTGNIPAYDPETNEPDAIMADINQQQEMDHPDKAIRYDKYTFAQALHYLEKYQPEFLWISFEGADSAAHHNDLELYHQSLLFFDNALDTLFTTLKNLGIADSTLVIVTTDHGRGDGEHWTSHGVLYPESKRTWAFVMNGALIPDRQDGDIYQYSTLSMRPTIEAALKLRTARG